MDTHNPYSAGDASLASAPPVFAGEIASKERRFLTLLVDSAVYYIVAAVALLIAVALVGEHMLEGANSYMVSIPVVIGYYAVFERLFGRTPGKFICGTRVVTEQGHAPSWRQVFGRSFARWIPFEPFSVLFSDENRGWHDSLSRTKVIRAR